MIQNWKRVRHVPRGPRWHPASDHLQGSANYGDPTDDNAAWSLEWNSGKYLQIHSYRKCTGYLQGTWSMRTTEDCYNWVKINAPFARYFLLKPGGNWHCAPCPASYYGSTTGLATSGDIHVYDMNMS